MVHVLLLILKIIGYTLLGLIGLVIALVLIVLLVPLRYRLQIEHGNELKAGATVSWMLHILHARVTYLDNQLKIWVKVFGYTVYDKDKPRKVNSSDKGKGFLGKLKKRKSNDETSDYHNEDIRHHKDENRKKDNSISNDLVKNPMLVKQQDKEIEIEKQVIEIEKQEIEIEKQEIEIEKQVIEIEKQVIEIKQQVIEIEPINKEVIINHKSVNHDVKQEIKQEIKQDIKQDVKQDIDLNHDASADEDNKKYDSNDNKDSERDKVKSGPFYKLKKGLHWIKNIKLKIKNIWNGIKARIKKLYKATININRIKDLILDFYHDQTNREGIKITLLSAKKLLKHILPTKVKSRLIFGTGDPCSTGQALSAMGILYTMYGDKIRITPDFNEKRFEGEHDLRGRIRILTLGIVILKLLLDKRWKELRKNLNTLKEAL